MALPVQKQLQYWGIAVAVLILVLWQLGDVLLPFVLGAAVAFCLDPVADWFESKGFSRVSSVVIISLVALVGFILAILLIIPTLVTQGIELVQFAPKLFEQLQAFTGSVFERLTERFPQLADADSTIRQQLDKLGQMVQSRGGEFLTGLVSSFSGIVNVVLLIVIVPVVSFYLLLDWDRMVAQIDALLPLDHAPTIRQLARDMNETLAGFIRGMGTVSLILGIYYCVMLMAIGLNFGLVIGALAGLVTFIPYVGALVGGVLAIGLALFQFWGDWFWIIAVAAVFFSGQFLEGNILTPKLVGESVGLHPVWLILSLSVFGSLFGFVGMLVAVPLAAMIGVIIRFFANQYKQGRLYKGVTGLQSVEDQDTE